MSPSYTVELWRRHPAPPVGRVELRPAAGVVARLLADTDRGSALEHGPNQRSPGFDHTVRVVRIDAKGRNCAPVPTPGGLTLHAGELYAASHLAEAPFAHERGKGQVVRVAQRAFKK